MKHAKYIPLDKCKDGYLYIIYARNSNLGIYKEDKKAFTISRFKFSSNFLDEEVHWDVEYFFGSMRFLGTAKPLKEFGKSEIFEKDEDTLRYLNELWKCKEMQKFWKKMNEEYLKSLKK